MLTGICSRLARVTKPRRLASVNNLRWPTAALSSTSMTYLFLAVTPQTLVSPSSTKGQAQRRHLQRPITLAVYPSALSSTKLLARTQNPNYKKMNTYQAPANPAEIQAPNDGTPSQHDLNPISGVQRATAQSSDAPVMYQGVQLSRQQAEELGILNQPLEPTTKPSHEDKPTTTEDREPNNLDSEFDTDAGAADESVSNETRERVSNLFNERGDILLSSVKDILGEDAELTPETLADLLTEAGVGEEEADKSVQEFTQEFHTVTNGRSALLPEFAKQHPQEAHSATVAALLGDHSELIRVTHLAAQTLDQGTLADGLVESLEANEYQTEVRNGRLWLRGNDIPAWQPWSRVYESFDLAVI